MMSRLVIMLAFLAPGAYAADAPAPRPPLPCLQVPPDVRASLGVKPTDCLRVIEIVKACDVTPPDIAKRLGLNLKCPNWPEQKK